MFVFPIQWFAHSSSLCLCLPLWTSRASFLLQVINVATRKRLVLFRNSVTSSKPSHTCRHCFHSLERFSQRISIFGGKETLHENVVVLVALVDGGVAFSPSAGISTALWSLRWTCRAARRLNETKTVFTSRYLDCLLLTSCINQAR